MRFSISGLKGFSYAILSSATFGLIPLLALPVVAAGMNTASVLFYRFAISALLMGLITVVKRSTFRITAKESVFIFLLGFFYAATALLLLDAYTFIPSGIATTIHFLYPVMVALIMILFFKEKKSGALFLAILLSLGGVAFLSWNGEASLNYKGVTAALSSIFTYALYIVGIHKSDVKRMDEYTLTFYILLSSAFFFLVNVLFTGGVQPIPDIKSGISIFLLALLPTVVSDLALVLAIKHIGSTTTSVLGSMEPLTAVALGVAVFNEPFDMKTFIGIACILVAVFVVIMNKQVKS
ncbi:MAG: DMT family transporter [Bacteroidales bacterium]